MTAPPGRFGFACSFAARFSPRFSSFRFLTARLPRGMEISRPHCLSMLLALAVVAVCTAAPLFLESVAWILESLDGRFLLDG